MVAGTDDVPKVYCHERAFVVLVNFFLIERALKKHNTMSYEWLEMQREAERHQSIEQYLRNNLVQDVYGSPGQVGSSPSHALRTARVASLERVDMYAPPVTAPLTTGDKVRITFTDLDFNKNGVIDVSEFARGCETVKLPLVDPSPSDLFQKAKGSAVCIF